jgi:hypothetical protein
LTSLLKSQTIIIILSAFIILIIFFAVPIIPISYQEPYEIEVPYTEQEEYTIEVPYEVQVEVTKTKTIIDRSLDLSSPFTWITLDFMIDSDKEGTISWSSNKPVLLFSIMKNSTCDALYNALVLELGSSVVTAFITGGVVSSADLTALPPVIISTVPTVVTTQDYYLVNHVADSTRKYFESGFYKLVLIDVSTGARATLHAQLSHDYTVMETQTRYRTETSYRTVTKYRTETHYRTKTGQVTIWNLLTESYTQ